MPASERTALLRSAAAHEGWARTPDPTARTANGRKAFLTDRFEREVDPDGVLEPAERARRAQHARIAYFKRLAAKSAAARADRAKGRKARNVEAGPKAGLEPEGSCTLLDDAGTCEQP